MRDVIGKRVRHVVIGFWDRSLKLEEECSVPFTSTVFIGVIKSFVPNTSIHWTCSSIESLHFLSKREKGEEGREEEGWQEHGCKKESFGLTELEYSYIVLCTPYFYTRNVVTIKLPVLLTSSRPSLVNYLQFHVILLFSRRKYLTLQIRF